jgi:hypothetical protein
MKSGAQRRLRVEGWGGERNPNTSKRKMLGFAHSPQPTALNRDVNASYCHPLTVALAVTTMKNDELLEAIAELETDTGVKNGFFTSLLKEDDWSFIIKIHALYEAAVSNLITHKIGQIELEDFVSRLELGDKSRGKLKLAKELNLLDDNERKFIYSLSEIRNSFVHNVRNTQVNLDKYFAGLDENKKQNYINVFGYTYPEKLEIAGKTVNSKVFTRENPKIAIWHNSMYVLAVISCITSTEKSRRSIEQTILKLHELQGRRLG